MAASLGFYVNVDNEQVLAFLADLTHKVSGPGMGAFLKEVAVPIVQQTHRERFDSEGDAEVGFWEALRPATVERRRWYGYGGAHPINVRTGQLEHYITQSEGSVAVGGATARLRFPGRESTNALTMKKLTVAQAGWSDPVTPARPVLSFGPNDLVSVLSAMTKWLSASFDGN